MKTIIKDVLNDKILLEKEEGIESADYYTIGGVEYERFINNIHIDKEGARLEILVHPTKSCP